MPFYFDAPDHCSFDGQPHVLTGTQRVVLGDKYECEVILLHSTQSQIACEWILPTRRPRLPPTRCVFCVFCVFRQHAASLQMRPVHSSLAELDYMPATTVTVLAIQVRRSRFQGSTTGELPVYTQRSTPGVTHPTFEKKMIPITSQNITSHLARDSEQEGPTSSMSS